MVLVVIAHWPLLVSDSVLWDGTYVANAAEKGDFAPLHGLFRTMGMPLASYVHAGIGSLPGYVHVYKALAFVCLIVSSLAIYSLLRRFRFAAGESFLIAGLAAVYPSYSSWHEFILPYHIAYAAFFGGLAVLWRDRSPARFPTPRLFIAIGLLALAMAFMNSLFVYIYGVLACVFLATAQRYRFRDMWEFFKGHLTIILFPPLEFVLLRLAFPRIGLAVRYNEVQVDAAQVGKMMLVSPKRIVVDQIVDLFTFARHDPVFFVLLLVYSVAALAGVGWALRCAPTQRPSGKRFAGILFGSAVLFVTGVFPYAVVGKFPQINSYNDRHAILTLVPVAIGIVMVLRFAIRSDHAFRIAGISVLAVCCALQVRNYMMWQNRYVKYLAMIENLKDQEDKLQSVVVFDDRADFGERELLRPYEANWILKHSFRNERHLGFDARQLNRMTYDRAEHDWDRTVYIYSDAKLGTEATLVEIARGDTLSEPKIFFGYYLAGSEGRAAFVKPLVTLRFTDTPVQKWLEK